MGDVDEQHDSDRVETLAQIALQTLQHLEERNRAERRHRTDWLHRSKQRHPLGATCVTPTCDMLFANTRMKMSPWGSLKNRDVK